MRGQEIERESFRIIEGRLGGYSAKEKEVIRRIIHATADFSFARSVVFHSGPIKNGTRAIRAKRDIITDVNMVKVGITSYKGRVKCFIDDADVKKFSKSSGKTRAASAFCLHKNELEGSIIAIGNAPTALFELCSLIEDGTRPALVIATPVGFVGARESKEMILRYDVPAIVLRGKRGGSSIAAAATNAMIKLSEEK